MEESNQHNEELEDLLTRRLLKNIEDEDRPNTTEEKTDTPAGREVEVLPKETDQNSVQEQAIEPAPDSHGEVVESEPQAAVPVGRSFAKVEKSLISLGFFTPSSRRIKDQKVKRISFTKTIDGKKVEATAEFHPSAMLGLPITADQDKFLALHDIITNRLQATGKISNPIRFTSAELLRLLNKRVRTGKNYKDIYEWLDVMTATTIFSNGVVYEAGKQRFAKDRFHVFDRAITVGKELPDGTIADANYVWLSDWQLENINRNFLLPIDLLTYRELKNHIAKALVPLLQIWLFASQRTGSFEKRYDELCEMLSLKVYKAASLITRQLKPSLDELVKYEYLEKWRIEKTADSKAYKVIFFHGQKFHRDRRRRIEQKAQLEQSVVVAESEPDLPEPGKLDLTDAGTPATVAKKPAPAVAPKPVTNQPAETRPTTPVQAGGGEESGSPLDLIDQLSARGIMPSVAMKLLARIPAEQHETVFEYIEYWDSIPTQKRGTGLLYNLIEKNEPLPSSFESRRIREKKRTDEERAELLRIIKESLKADYEAYRHRTVDQFIATQLSIPEFERRVAVRSRELSSQQTLDLDSIWNRPEIRERQAQHEVRSQIENEINFLPFEEFRLRELPRILAELKLQPADLGITSPANQDIPETGTV